MKGGHVKWSKRKKQGVLGSLGEGGKALHQGQASKKEPSYS